MWELLAEQIPYKDLSTAEIIKVVGHDDGHLLPVPPYRN